MATVKSEIIKKLSDNYPNFLKKDLIRLVDIFLEEVKNSLKRGERVELRDNFSIEPRLQKARFSRNPKTNQKFILKKNIHYYLNHQKCGQIK